MHGQTLFTAGAVNTTSKLLLLVKNFASFFKMFRFTTVCFQYVFSRPITLSNSIGKKKNINSRAAEPEI